MPRNAGPVNVPAAHAMLQNEIASLPEPLAQEALDFVLFIKARHADEAFLWAQVEETQSHRRAHPEDVTTVTADEWEQLTAHMDG